MREARRLASFIQPALGEARLSRQWTAVATVVDRPVPPRRLLFAGGFAVAVVAAIVVAWRTVRAPLVSPGTAQIATIEGGAVTLADGSRVTAEAGGRVRVLAAHGRDVELVVEAGAVDLDVPHVGRRVTVHAGRYDVVDLGTRFRVALGAEGQVSVRVAEGAVEVRSRAGTEPPRSLSAGDEWSNGSPVGGRPASLPAPVPPADAAPVDPAPPAEVTAPAPTLTPAPAAVETPSSARDLLDLAERQRLAGNPRAAAAALDALRRRHRADPRAALAAFELGRLRLDAFGDPQGAVEALNDSIALAPKGPLREDAEARRVEALEIEHSPDCPAARDAFLARYPRGVHRAVVAARCGSP
jgi:transmembrane sensor